jgi:hypothetical protein
MQTEMLVRARTDDRDILDGRHFDVSEFQQGFRYEAAKLSQFLIARLGIAHLAAGWNEHDRAEKHGAGPKRLVGGRDISESAVE